MIPGVAPVLILLGLGAIVLAGHAGALDAVLAKLQGRGSRVGRATHPNTLGVVEDDPQSLADSAALDLGVYALARMISSEEGNSPQAQKVAVGWAAHNAHGGNLATVLTAGHGDADGHFKAQGYQWTSAPGETSKGAAYASTARDPYEDDVAIAQAIVNGGIADPTGGATNWFRPGLQDDEFAAGKVSKDAEGVIASWTAGGLARVDVPGVDDIAFFKKGVG